MNLVETAEWFYRYGYYGGAVSWEAAIYLAMSYRSLVLANQCLSSEESGADARVP